MTNIKEKQFNSFKDFTNLYEIQKTLRFSLIPVLTKKQEDEIVKEKGYSNPVEITRQDRVAKFFIENKQDIFEVDIERKKRYQALKYYLTEFHKLFIKDALQSLQQRAELDFSKLFKNYRDFEKSRDDDERKRLVKNITDEKKQLAKNFKAVFQETAKNYHDFLKNRLKGREKIKGGDEEKKSFAEGTKNILLSRNVVMILREKIKDGKIQEKIENDKDGENKFALEFIDVQGNKTNLIDYFDGWSTYFRNFNEIRGNLYKDDGRKDVDGGSGGEVRIKKANVGQITTRVLDENFEIFIKNVIMAERNKTILGLDDFQKHDLVNRVSILSPDFYKNCFLQEDINKYNQTISILNKFFNENRKGKDVKFLRHLHKQLLLDDVVEDKKEDFIEYIDDDDLVIGLNEFYKLSQEKTSLIKSFLRNDKITEDELITVSLDENQTHFFCNIFFGSWSYLRDLYYEQNEKISGKKIKKRPGKDDEFKDKEGILRTEISLLEIKDILNSIDRSRFQEDIKNAIESSSEERPRIIFDTLGIRGKQKVYQDDKSNFENFILFLKFYFDSLINGRELLNEKEKREKEKISNIKSWLEKTKAEGERIDGFLLSKFSKDNFVRNISESLQDKEKRFKEAFAELKQSINQKKRLSREKDFECKEAINEYCVRVSDINRFFALFVVPEGVTSGTLSKTIQQFKDKNNIIQIFNAVRNYITKREEEEEKIKLTFDNSTLLGGWAYRSTDYKCRLLEKQGNYYLLIIGDKIEHKEFKNSISDTLNEYQIMDYYQQKGRTIFGSTYKGKFTSAYETDRTSLENKEFIKHIKEIIDELLDNFGDVEKIQTELSRLKVAIEDKKFDFGIQANKFNELFKKRTGEEFSKYKNKKGFPLKEDITIDILKSELGEDRFDYEEEKEYLFNRIKEIMKDNGKKMNFLGSDLLAYEVVKLEPYYYKKSFRKIDFNDMDKELKNKQLFLFQIYCKDFSPKIGSNVKNPMKDLNTLQFEELFSKKNQKEPLFRLSGQAELFFQDKIDDYKFEKWERKDLKKPKTDKIPYKNRRYTEYQIRFHVPIVLNNINGNEDVNKKINHYIQERNDVKVLGIDRGEKHLVYRCLLDTDGKICNEIISMNIIGSNIKDGEKQKINYQKKLDIKEKERLIARRSWTKIEGIKNLKRGFNANLVHEIAKLMVAENAILCLEELNYGFKQSRTKIDKSIYQQFENAMVDKLNYLALEKTSQGIRNALQLTPPKRAQKYWGNQMGAIFYTDARFTSKTCPHCGFRRRGIGFRSVKDIKDKIDNSELKIFYEKERDRFKIEYYWEYEYQQDGKIKKFSSDDLFGKGNMEYIYSDVDRRYWNNDTLKDIFKNYLMEDKDLFSFVKNESNFRCADFGKVFDSLTWMRHIVIDQNDNEYDRISCPKCHFSTCSQKVQKVKNGDANGAYNIARKGLLVLEKIRSEKLRKKINTRNGIKSKDLKIFLQEWDEATYKWWDKKDWEDSKNERGL